MKSSMHATIASAAASGAGRGIQRTAGFTLIELMIVVAIVAILAMIALPSYQQQMMKARRSQAKADLTELAQQLERYYTVNRTYVGFDFTNSGITTSPRDGNPFVAYAIAPDGAVAAAAYKLVATAQGPQGQDRCANLTLDVAGRKTHGGPGDDATCDWGTTAP